VELGSLSYNSDVNMNGLSASTIAISQTAGSNARDVINQCLKVLDDASKSFPEGIHYINLVNANVFWMSRSKRF
jgi:HAE1 family hydrophobic/amphiphilic exporter-1